MIPSLPEKVELQSEAGDRLGWLGERQARDLIARRKVRIVRRGGKVQKLVAITAELGASTLQVSMETGRGSALSRTKYSHNHETETNPTNVWTLKPIRGSRAIFMRVLTDCIPKAA